jgi:hypothetical protein
MRQARLGKPRSAEVRAKISATQRRRHELKRRADTSREAERP